MTERTYEKTKWCMQRFPQQRLTRKDPSHRCSEGAICKRHIVALCHVICIYICIYTERDVCVHISRADVLRQVHIHESREPRIMDMGSRVLHPAPPGTFQGGGGFSPAHLPNPWGPSGGWSFKPPPHPFWAQSLIFSYAALLLPVWLRGIWADVRVSFLTFKLS